VKILTTALNQVSSVLCLCHIVDIIITVEWELGAWLSAVSQQGYFPLGHEGSCQLLSIRVATAVTLAAYIGLSFEDLRGLSVNYKKNMSYFPRGLPSKPISPPNFSVQYQLIYLNIPLPLDGQM
jgi:hypothetical protein